MKTTVDISDHILVRAKELAAEQRRPLREVIEDGLQLLLARHRLRGRRPKRIDLPVWKGGKPVKGIDLDDTSKLLEI